MKCGEHYVKYYVNMHDSCILVKRNTPERHKTGCRATRTSLLVLALELAVDIDASRLMAEFEGIGPSCTSRFALQLHRYRSILSKDLAFFQ